MVGFAGEGPYVENAVSQYSHKYSPGMPFPAAINTDQPEQLQFIADAYIQIMDSISSHPVITDKTLGNHIFIGILHRLLPNAKFVYVKRHPVATCYGCYKRVFSGASLAYSYNMDHLVETYRDYSELMAHWEKVLPGKIHTVEYEKLIADQENVTRKLLQYCELPWEPQCLDFHKNERAVNTLSNTQVRQKLYTSAIDQWQQHQQYLGPLMALADIEQSS
jgi:hypothetical protein